MKRKLFILTIAFFFVFQSIQYANIAIALPNTTNNVLSTETSISNLENTITKDDFVLGYGISKNTGELVESNNKFIVTKNYIARCSDCIYIDGIFTDSSALNIFVQVAYYDNNKKFISVTDFKAVTDKITLESNINYGYIRLSFVASKTLSFCNMLAWGNNYALSLGMYNSIPYDKVGNIENKNAKNIIKVAKSGGDYTTIQEAVKHSTDNDTILVYPGLYEEYVNTSDNTFGNKRTFKSIIGIDRTQCKIISHVDTYGKEPLWVSKGYFKNLSIITDDNSAKTSSRKSSYAVHLDNNWENGSKAIFENCYFYSKNAAAVGIGTRPNCNVVFRNCVFKSDNSLGMGSVLLHNSADPTNQGANQKIKFENCNFISTYGSPIHIQRVGDDTNTMDLTISKSLIFSKINGVVKAINIDDSLYKGKSGNNINVSENTVENNINVASYIENN